MQPPPPETVPATLWQRLRARWQRTREWCCGWWRLIRPTSETRRGAVIGVSVLVLAHWFYLGTRATPLPTRIGSGFAIAALALLVLWLAWLALRLLLFLVYKLPRRPATWVAVCLVLYSIAWPNWQAPLLIGLTAALLGAVVASRTRPDFASFPRPRRSVTDVLLGISLVAAIGYAGLAWWDGSNKGLTDYTPPRLGEREQLQAPDPARPGPFETAFLTYGPGTDQRRPEYGAETGLKSRSVDGSKLLKELTGWKRQLRLWYWGFETKAMPLNGRVWYPKGAGPFPLVLCVHGNHLAQEFSDPGYEYLGQLLATRGYIFVSVDENFLNGSVMPSYGVGETAARGWLLLEHLKQWREWNQAAGHPFAGKVDLERVAVAGHSRGGEAAATAASLNRLPRLPSDATLAFDYNFGIRAVAAIAPVDGQYRPAGHWRTLHDVSYFVLHGGFDADVSSFDGAQQFGRVSFSPGFDGFKAGLWIYRANHGQFNTVWGRFDGPPPNAWFLNVKPLLAAPDQRRIALVYLSAFFDAALWGRKEYLPLFEDARRAAGWLPEGIYVQRFETAGFTTLCDYEEDYNVATGSLAGVRIEGEGLALWREQKIQQRRGNREDFAVYLGWREPGASYTVRLPAGFARTLSPGTRLEYSLADPDEKVPPPEGAQKDGAKKKDEPEEKKPDKPQPIEFSVELLLSGNRVLRLPAEQLGPLYPPLRSRLVKFTLPGWNPFQRDNEPVLQRYSAALEDFATGAKFNPAELEAIRFRFDRTKKGVLALDRIGFSTPPY